MVFLHGFAASAFTWDRLRPHLAPGVRPIFLEREWTPPTRAAEATLADMDRRGLRSPVVVGHSAGAEIALAVALRDPARVSALVLLAPVFDRGAPTPVRWLARAPGIAAIAPGVLRAATRVGFETALRSAWSDRSRLSAEMVEGYRRPLLAPGVAEAMWAMTAAHQPLSLGPLIKEMSTPILVITGDSDRWTRPVTAPLARRVVLHNCGHFPHEERAEEVATEIHRFMVELRR